MRESLQGNRGVGLEGAPSGWKGDTVGTLGCYLGMVMVVRDIHCVINRLAGVYPSYLVIHIQAASRNVGL